MMKLRCFCYVYVSICLVALIGCSKSSSTKTATKYNGPIYFKFCITGNGLNNSCLETVKKVGYYSVSNNLTVCDISNSISTNSQISSALSIMHINGKLPLLYNFNGVNTYFYFAIKDKRNNVDTIMDLRSDISDFNGLTQYQCPGKIEIKEFNDVGEAIVGTFQGELVSGFYDEIQKKAIIVKKYTVTGDFALNRGPDYP